MKTTSFSERFIPIVSFLLMCGLTLIIAVPVYYLVVTTFKTSYEAAVSPLSLPSSFSFNAYVDAFVKMEYPRAFMNTFLITAFSVAGVILSASMGGYVLNRKSGSKWGKIIFIFILAGIMFPYQMSVLGLYKVVQSLHLMNTLTAVILINIAVNIPFATFMFRSFVSTIPGELEEAAKIDGAGFYRVFWIITFPLMKPIIATVAILNALTIWNDFMGPLYFIQSREKNVILQEVYRNVGQFSTDWTSMFPMMVLGVLPLLAFYLIMQKYIIGGVMNGALKG
ncbi:carbohydrate ABC transporter permease [Paenibacillus vietnamensis]|uniref:carbohydrate ABC transporter permease n=1 Tax=Paenibacillus vietnamensis TaxID=2590547 RepID=UPI001CD076FF|nr:carbohydrate ABC transporter permease [Paenibacillus vietnamensis]